MPISTDVLHVSGDIDCNRILPRKPLQLGVLQNGPRLWGGTGVPAATLGNNGDFFFRRDGGGAGATHIYAKNAGAWLGIA